MHFYAQQGSIGWIKSKYKLLNVRSVLDSKFYSHRTGSKRNYGQANSQLLVINGQYSCIIHTNMTKTIHGKAFCRALYWSRLVDVDSDVSVAELCAYARLSFIRLH